MKLCKHFDISLHKFLGVCVLPLVPKIILHLNIYDSLPGVVSVTIAIMYLILPLNMYMQMMQNMCF